MYTVKCFFVFALACVRAVKNGGSSDFSLDWRREVPKSKSARDVDELKAQLSTSQQLLRDEEKAQRSGGENEEEEEHDDGARVKSQNLRASGKNSEGSKTVASATPKKDVAVASKTLSSALDAAEESTMEQ